MATKKDTDTRVEGAGVVSEPQRTAAFVAPNSDEAAVMAACRDHSVWRLVNRVEALVEATRQAPAHFLRHAASISWLLAEIRGEVRKSVMAQSANTSDPQVDFALQVLRNCGVDTECGACMEIAFCGSHLTAPEHECGRAMLANKLIQPLPWRAEAQCDDLWRVVDTNDFTVLGGVTADEARYIVEACNAYPALKAQRDALLAALKAATGYMTNAVIGVRAGEKKDATVATLNAGLYRTRAAIASVESAEREQEK